MNKRYIASRRSAVSFSPLLLVLAFAQVAGAGNLVSEATLDWGLSFEDESGRPSVAADGMGNFYYLRDVNPTYPFSIVAPYRVGLLSKIDSSGAILWSQEFGTEENQKSYAVSVDQTGSVFSTGEIWQGARGDIYVQDVFVSKHDPNGSLSWFTKLGTDKRDFTADVIPSNDGGAYVVGFTDGVLGDTSVGGRDAFVSKFDSNGELVWTDQFGSPDNDNATSVAMDSAGNVYVVGITLGEMATSPNGQLDSFVRKYDSIGNHLWTQQFGTKRDDLLDSISIDQFGNILLAGTTGGDLGGIHASQNDHFVSRLQENGEFLWTTQVNTVGADNAEASFADDLGNVYVIGKVRSPISGTRGGVIRKFNAQGDLVWEEPIDSPPGVHLHDISADARGNIIVAGNSYDHGFFTGIVESRPYRNPKGFFVVKYSVPIPEPASICLMPVLLAAGMRRVAGRRAS